MKPKYSVIIPAFNEEKYLPACLESVIKYTPQEKVEIIVVDNASTDNTSQIAKNFKGVRVIKEPQKGLTYARQAGLNAALGQILAYIDADSHIYPGWFEILETEFENPEVVSISGPYKYYDLPKPKQKLVDIYQNIVAVQTSIVTKALVMGANFAARKEALLKIGGFDTSIIFYGEDADIGFRLSKVGEVKFLKHFYIYTSARRLHTEGFFKMGSRYALNYLWRSTFKKPLTQKYQDIR